MNLPWVSRLRYELEVKRLQDLLGREQERNAGLLDALRSLRSSELQLPEDTSRGYLPVEGSPEAALPGSTETVPVQGAQAVAVLDPGPSLPAETLRRVSQVVAAAESRKERDRQIVAECRKGTKSHAEIGREFGLSAARIAQIATAAGLPHRPSGRQRKGRG